MREYGRGNRPREKRGNKDYTDVMFVAQYKTVF